MMNLRFAGGFGPLTRTCNFYWESDFCFAFVACINVSYAR